MIESIAKSVETSHPILEQWRNIFDEFRNLKKEERVVRIDEANKAIRQFLDQEVQQLSAEDLAVVIFGIRRFIGYSISPELSGELKELEQKITQELPFSSDAVRLTQIASHLGGGEFSPARLHNPLANQMIDWMR
jgi:hypothetical protein